MLIMTFRTKLKRNSNRTYHKNTELFGLWGTLCHAGWSGWIISGPSSSCDMIILRNNSHGGIIRVCMGIFTTALRNKQNTSNSQQKKNTSPYFHSVSFVIWPLTLMKRTHFSDLSISRFSTYIRKGLFFLLRKMIISQLELGLPVHPR